MRVRRNRATCPQCGATRIVKYSDYHKRLCVGCRARNVGKQKRQDEAHKVLVRRWRDMKSRCYRIKDRAYPDYGERGIVVCDEWHDFESFKRWSLANGFAPNLTLERDNVNASYSPSNCRWIPRFDQYSNTRRTRTITYMGETKTISQWARVTGISRGTIRDRYFVRGWSAKDTFEKPVVLGNNQNT